ncbi:hypothetical protein VFPPC_14173 [Pochonia chlamydosporia 170]|uniref:DUF7907 domain-containing protein n=1 Tax=Pochonia chlamydosporia 170 TaxID=1380566 RepID=A0A179FA04_METCM|nr:hypothetical protein VFPPC_14173 [Pochonia chlamydosporia 170]OAQ62160.1 hypothetical protein VFPPC_14173 [Pochonia chlamydosporia 170]
MRSILLTLIMSLASASPITPAYPETTTSKGFRLVVNVTDPSRDFNPPIHNTYITGSHVGTLNDAVIPNEDKKHARIFFVNGTQDEANADKATTIWADWDTYRSWKLNLESPSQTLSGAFMSGGEGTVGAGIRHYKSPYAFLTPETYVACRQVLPIGGEQVVIKQAKTTYPTNGSPNYNIPKDCAPVRLLSECAELLPLSPDARFNYRFAVESQCYKDVRGIDWTKYM